MEWDPKTAKYLYFFAISKNGNFRFCKLYDFPKMVLHVVYFNFPSSRPL